MASNRARIRSSVDRNRFIVLLTLCLGFVSSLLKATLLPGFPIVEFLTFAGPLALGAYGVRTYRSLKENQNEEPPRIDPLMG